MRSVRRLCSMANLKSAIFLVIPAIAIVLLYSFSTAYNGSASISDSTKLRVERGVVMPLNSGIQSDDYLHRNAIFAAQQTKRQKFIAGKPRLFELIESIVVQINCPGAVRLGHVGDGGKWVCRPWRHSPNCVVYSLGVGEDPTFEQEVVNVTNCQTYSFDPDTKYENLFKFDRMNFRPWRISSKSSSDTDKSVADAMRILNHTKLDIVKIDIEGSEYTSMRTIFEHSKTHQICQILTEVHAKNMEKWRKLLAQYERADYYIFSVESNWGCSPIACVEYAHMHKSCFAQYGIDPRETVVKNFG